MKNKNKSDAQQGGNASEATQKTDAQQQNAETQNTDTQQADGQQESNASEVTQNTDAQQADEQRQGVETLVMRHKSFTEFYFRCGVKLTKHFKEYAVPQENVDTFKKDTWIEIQTAGQK